VCATALAMPVGLAEVEGLAVCLDLGAVCCDAGRALRSGRPRDGPATPSPKVVSHEKGSEGLRRTVKSGSQLGVFTSFSFEVCFPHVTSHLLEASDPRLTPAAVVLLWVRSDLSSQEWKKAAHEQQVARRRTEHWYEEDDGMGGHNRDE
jgi:hypothetical protein